MGTADHLTLLWLLILGTHFYDYLHPTVLQKGISEFLVTTLFTDVVLIVGSEAGKTSISTSSSSVQRFPAHRIVLSVKCRALRILFEENPDQREFYLEHINDPDILFLMLSFIYSGKVSFCLVGLNKFAISWFEIL